MDSKTKKGIIGIFIILISVFLYLNYEGVITSTDKPDKSIKISATQGGQVLKDDMAIYFPADMSTIDFNITVTKKNQLPDTVTVGESTITNLNQYFHPISPIYNVKSTEKNFKSAFHLSLTFEPQSIPKLRAQGQELLFVTISNGELEILRPVDGDLRSGFIMAEVRHNSDFAICTWDKNYFVEQQEMYQTLWSQVIDYMTHIPKKAETHFGQALSKYMDPIKDYFRYVDVATDPSVFLEPENAQLADFIKKNGIDTELKDRIKNLKNPKYPESKKDALIVNFSGEFKQRDDMLKKRALTIDEILTEKRGVCIDLSHLYASVLYRLGFSDLKLIQGTCFGVKHVWIEVILDDRPYVVDTTGGEAFILNEINFAYKEQTLIPEKMYSIHDNALISYNPQWYIDILEDSLKTQAKIDALEREYQYIEREYKLYQGVLDKLKKFFYMNSSYLDKLQRIQTEIDQMRIFGTAKKLNGAFQGTIYELPTNTSSLPTFSKESEIGTIYNYTLNIPQRAFDSGFPGASNRYEWFALNYEGQFIVQTAGNYEFELNSDDGSRLFIDGQEVINNDGIHAPNRVTGSIYLEQGIVHNINVQYFQGPRMYIALQLFVTPPKGSKEIFDIRKRY